MTRYQSTFKTSSRNLLVITVDTSACLTRTCAATWRQRNVTHVHSYKKRNKHERTVWTATGTASPSGTWTAALSGTDLLDPFSFINVRRNALHQDDDQTGQFCWDTPLAANVCALRYASGLTTRDSNTLQKLHKPSMNFVNSYILNILTELCTENTGLRLSKKFSNLRTEQFICAVCLSRPAYAFLQSTNSVTSYGRKWHGNTAISAVHTDGFL